MGNSWDFFENINEVVYVADIETHTLVYMNRKALDVFGIDLLEQVQGKSCHQRSEEHTSELQSQR